MKRILIAMLCTPALAFAEDAKPAAAAPPAAMEMPKPGAEQKALAPFFPASVTMNGKMVAGTMGPGSPELPTHSKQSCKSVVDGFQIVCDIDSKTGTGKQAMSWKGHFVMGWDAAGKSYKAFGVDNLGGMMIMKGTIDGKKLTLVTTEPVSMMGMSFTDRVTWDLDKMTFTDEHQVPGTADWKVVEEDKITVGGKK